MSLLRFELRHRGLGHPLHSKFLAFCRAVDEVKVIGFLMAVNDDQRSSRRTHSDEDKTDPRRKSRIGHRDIAWRFE